MSYILTGIKQPEVCQDDCQTINKQVQITIEFRSNMKLLVSQNRRYYNTKIFQITPLISYKKLLSCIFNSYQIFFLIFLLPAQSLERNMSLSGQYLEELSRRYKTQVEELQTAFSKTLAVVEEQNRRNLERESFYIGQIMKLQEAVDELNETFSWPNIFFYVSIVAGIQLFIIFLIVRIWMRRLYRKLLSATATNRSPPATTDAANKFNENKIRRKSIDVATGGQCSNGSNQRQRRPSDDVSDHISGTSYAELLIDNNNDDDDDDDDIYNVTNGIEDYDNFGGVADASTKPKNRNRKQPIIRAVSLEPIRTVDAKLATNASASSSDYEKLKKRYVDSSKPMLDDEYEVYMPGTDLMYNEFMPGGPSGPIGPAGDIGNASTPKSVAPPPPPAKSRRVSSPAFLKSPFSSSSHSNGGGGGGGSNSSGSVKNKPAHESKTGWQWYRLKKGTSVVLNDVNDKDDDDGSGIIPAGQSHNQVKNKKKSKVSTNNANVVATGAAAAAAATTTTTAVMRSNGKGKSTKVGVGNSSDSMVWSLGSTTSKTSSSSTTTTATTTTTGGSKKQGSFRKILRKVF